MFLLGFGLFLAGITDFLTGEIPIFLFPSIAFIHTILNFSSLTASNYVGMIVMIIIMLIAALFGGGGGDILMYGAIGLIMGIQLSLVITIFSFLFYSIFLIFFCSVTENNFSETVLPLAPFTFVTFCMLDMFICFV